MCFWKWDCKDTSAVVTINQTYTYGELNHDIQIFEDGLKADKKELILILCENKYEVIVAYIAAMRSGHAIMLLDASLKEALLNEIIFTYKPFWIYSPSPLNGYEQEQGSLWKRIEYVKSNIHPSLAILLSTSGTTGSRKFVRLSYNNIQSNAKSIAKYLELNERERGVVNLPVSYSYGLSVINSHLEVGATLLLTDESVMNKLFWSFLNKERATSFTGVPFTYQILQRIGFLKMDLPDLKSFTQAGGRLDERLVKQFGEYAIEHGKKFYVMYGQTEASPRMSYIPAEQLLMKAGTIGIAIPDGAFQIEPETNELIYSGPNVMMGYAENLKDLAKEDEYQGVLYTGDTATVDADEFYTITGRLKRFVKLFGLRVNLDEMEKHLEIEIESNVACTGNDDRLIIVVEAQDSKSAIKDCLESVYKLHKSAFRIYVVESIPRLSNGKTDYRSIKDVFK